MPLTQLTKTQWQAYFDRFSRALSAAKTHVEVTGLGLPHQAGADYIPLTGISYDPENDVLVVFAGRLEHPIRHPRQVHIDRDLEWVHSIEVLDGDGSRHYIMLKEAVELPAP